MRNFKKFKIIIENLRNNLENKKNFQNIKDPW